MFLLAVPVVTAERLRITYKQEKGTFVNATFSSNLANVTAARPCLLECMRLLCDFT